MRTSRRSFIQVAGAASAGMVSGGIPSGKSNVMAPVTSLSERSKASYMTELFLDDHLIEVTPGVSRRLKLPAKCISNPVVGCDRWWEGNTLDPYTTMYDSDERLFKMWARAGSDWNAAYVGGNAAYMTYLTSTDGVHWEKPSLGVVELGGRRDHNVIFTSDMVAAGPSSQGDKRFVQPSKPMAPQGKKAFFWSVMKNPHPRDAGEKYLALAIVQDHRSGAHLVTSPDGIHWSCANAPFWQTPHDVASIGDDCLMEILYDEERKQWVVYRRIVPEFSERMVADESDQDRKLEDRYDRCYARVESDDLREWKNFRFILSMDADDPADTELYQFSCHKYGEIYVGYMSVFHLDAQSIDIQLATSRDGINFTRVCRGQPFIPSGTLGYYDYMAMGCDQPVPVILNDRAYFYYAAYNFRHDADMATTDPHTLKGGAALATFERDRFVSLETGDRDSGPSRVITKPFVVRHPKLFLNAATGINGSVRVEALTRDWRPIPGFSEPLARDIQGNALDHPVRWQENPDVSKLLGKEIRLKFYMTRARIHAMTLSNQDRKLGAIGGESSDSAPPDYSPKFN